MFNSIKHICCIFEVVQLYIIWCKQIMKYTRKYINIHKISLSLQNLFVLIDILVITNAKLTSAPLRLHTII